jgi:hypothetical protein
MVRGVTRDAADVTVYLTDAGLLDLNDRLDLPEVAVLLGNLVDLRLHVPDLPLGLRLLTQLGTAVLFLAMSAGALALARVLRTVWAGRPCARHNVTSPVVVAVAVIVGAGIAPLVQDVDALDCQPGDVFQLAPRG